MRISAISSLACIAAAIAAPAWAQDVPDASSQSDVSSESDSSLMGDIVVTAQKRDQNIQDVGISITAFSGEQLSALGVTNAQDLVQITPGLRNPQSGGGFTSSFSIRGLSQSDFGASQEAPVALYVDEVYQASQGAAQFLLFDIERTEVLRGPQGTLFGRNATGGLVHFITKKPSQDVGGYAELTYGRFNEVKAEGAINVPFSDTVSMRLSLVGNWRDPIDNNTTGRDLWNKKRYAGRLQVLFEPTDDVSFLVSGKLAQQRERGVPYIWTSSKPTGFANTGEFTPTLPDNFGFDRGVRDNFTFAIDDVHFHDVDTQAITGTLSWDFGGVSLTSITDFNHVKVSYAEDADMDIGEFFHFVGTQEAEQFSQEVRLNGEVGDGFRWVTGLYYLDVSGAYLQRGLIADLGFPGVAAQDTFYTVQTKSGSVFAQVEYDLTDQFRAIAGGRYIRERKAQDYVSAFKDAPGGNSVGFGSTPDLYRFNEGNTQGIYSLKAELDYIPNRDVLVYLSYSRGVKSGGFSSPLDPSGSSIFIDPATFDPSPTADEAMRFKPETLHAYELGVKTTLFDGKARFNVSAFYYDYKNFQALNFQGISTSYLTNNDATLKGVDADLMASPIDGLDIIVGASYLDQVVNDIAIGTELFDRKIPYAPEWNFTGLIRYEWDALGGKASVQANTNYVSTQFLGLTNAAVLEEKGYALFNARVSYKFPDEKMSVSVFVDNLTDERYRVIAFDQSGFSGSTASQIGMPRTYGLTLRYDLER